MVLKFIKIFYNLRFIQPQSKMIDEIKIDSILILMCFRRFPSSKLFYFITFNNVFIFQNSQRRIKNIAKQCLNFFSDDNRLSRWG